MQNAINSVPAKPASNILGISGKSINRAEKPKRIKGVALEGTVNGRVLKYDLLRTAGSVLYSFGKSAAEQHRTCWCHRGVASAADSVRVYRQKNGESARLHGVTTCKSVWTCPVCSARICAVRQAELSTGMKNWIGQGGYVWLLTLTFPHEFGIPLAELMEKFTKAKAYFKNCKTYKRILAKGVRAGSVSSLEVTLGQHGWHPHQHDLIFATPDAFGDVTETEAKRMHSRAIDELKAAWYMALRKADLCEQSQMSDVLAHGLDVRGGQYAAEYVAKFGHEQKWGLSREVTMHVAKTGSDTKGAHPFQLLTWAGSGDAQAANQFREYADAFEGKRMLNWSRGLKAKLLIDEVTDDEAEQMEMPEDEVIGRIDSEALSVLSSRRLVGNFLGYVAQYCVDPDTWQSDIDEYIRWARSFERTARGDVKTKMHSRGFMHSDREVQAA